jgi:chromosome partitioning protein
MFIVAIANQKGGVTKTTSTVSLTAALARAGKKVLMVDLDPQASLTEYFTPPGALEETMYHLIVDGKQIQPVSLGSFIRLLPATIDLAAAEVLLPSKPNFERRLSRFLRSYAEGTDYCLLDCPPSLGVLTRNALTAADTVLIPVSTEEMAKRTIPLIINQIEEVRESELNKGLYPWRILTTLYNMREKEDNETLHDIRQQYGNLVYPVPVPRRTNYKKAVRQRVDVSDLDSDLGDLWDQLAALLIEESHSIAGKRGPRD